jgi:predicted DNA-binding helix-hairpin-helix protein
MRLIGRCALWLSVAALVAGATAISSSAAQSSQSKASSKASSADAGAKVDLNTASEKDLESLPAVGPATAKKIIAGRPYSSVGDLSKAGVSASAIKKITSLVTVSGGTAAASSKAATPVAQSKASSAASRPAPEAPATTAAATAWQGTPGG